MKTNRVRFPWRTLTIVSLLSVSAALLYADPIAYVSFDGGVQSFLPGSTSGTQVVPPNNGANGLAVDSSGNLYYSDSGARTVYIVTPGGSISTYSSTSITVLEDYSTGLAFDSSGNLYVDDNFSNSVAKIDPFGVASTYVWDYDYTLNGPQGMAFDSHGNLFLADYGQIDEIAPGGGSPASVSAFASGGLLGNNGNLLFGLAINSSNDIFVSDPGTGQIFEVTPGGAVSTFASGLGTVNGLAFDGSGNLFAVNDQNCCSGNNQILEFAAGGNTPTVFASYTGDAGQFLALGNTALPEPATWSLFGLGGAACLLAARRKRARP